MILAPHKTNTISAELCLIFYHPNFINVCPITLTQPIDTMSIKSYKYFVKRSYLDQYYSEDCHKKNCYACNQKLFYPKYLSQIFQFIWVFAY